MTDLEKAYKDAIDVQSACNLSGVVFAFARHMQTICDTTDGTDQKNNHAVCRLFAEQIAWLTSGRDYGSAYAEAQEATKGRL